MTPTRFRLALGVGVVILAGLVVGAAFTPIPHTGGDNAGYIALAHGLLVNGSYTDVFDPEGLRHTKYPPVFPLLLALLISLGARTWATLKLAALLPTLAAVGLTYAWAERELSPIRGFGVALLLAVSSGIVYYSHWVLSDPLFLALTMLSLAALARSDGRSAGSLEEAADEEAGAKHGAHSLAAGGGGSPLDSWLIVGVAAAGLAYFTRSAGLPLVLALFAWLGLRRRWRALAVTGVALGLPMLAWWLRGRGAGVAEYGTEFWMVNPYDPSLGTIGIAGLIPRISENLTAYVFQHIPAGVVGGGGPGLSAMGVLLTGLAVAGWALTARRRLGPVELFTPLYAGLILVWPAVWGGDRFALPLFPILFVYAAIAIARATARLPELAARAVPAIALVALVLPAGVNQLESNRQGAACDRVAAERGPWACYGPQVGYFIEAAGWSGPGLPDGSAVLSRKPRHFYLQSGHPSRAFPFVEDVDAHLALADALGARYVLLDQWDGLAARHVGAAIRQRPGAFCYVRGFGSPAQGGAQLLGILPASARTTEAAQDGAGVAIGACPGDYVVPGAPETYSSSSRIPLLEGLDP